MGKSPFMKSSYCINRYSNHLYENSYGKRGYTLKSGSRCWHSVSELWTLAKSTWECSALACRPWHKGISSHAWSRRAQSGSRCGTQTSQWCERVTKTTQNWSDHRIKNLDLNQNDISLSCCWKRAQQFFVKKGLELKLGLCDFKLNININCCLLLLIVVY